MIEQYCGRTLIEAENGAANRAAPHKWFELSKRFVKIGVRLEDCKSYAGANECRILNNKIKHVGTVDGELSKFSRYHGASGTAIKDVKIEFNTTQTQPMNLLVG